jgi:uncharacterized repeat protein (TIGR04138 family)
VVSDARGFWESVEEIRRSDDRFAVESYGFVMDGLQHTLRMIGGQRHVTAHELLGGLCSYAHERYGVMSYTLLERWGIETTGDFGDIVFQLVDAGVLAKRDEDIREAFDDVFDLREVLEHGYFEQIAEEGEGA